MQWPVAIEVCTGLTHLHHLYAALLFVYNEAIGWDPKIYTTYGNEKLVRFSFSDIQKKEVSSIFIFRYSKTKKKKLVRYSFFDIQKKKLVRYSLFVFRY